MEIVIKIIIINDLPMVPKTPLVTSLFNQL